MDNKIYCVNCRKDIDYSIRTITLRAIIKDEDYEYTAWEPICNICGNEVCVKELHDKNLKSLYDVYRQKNGIISLENILEIPQKYNIESCQLSLLLGWEETTFLRYCEGDVPSKQHSEVLQKIHNEPTYFKTLLDSYLSINKK